MKFLKWLFILLGLAALVAGGAVLANVIWDMGKLLATVRSYNPNTIDPTRRIYYVAGLAALGGLLLGWGIGLPSRTGRAVRNQYKSDLEARGVVVDTERN
ncbi:hypothetical protein [Luteococcus sp. OSA5]|uniref:hypothetical protein n=1 Tax=Luteococcus sp. OSA5 TaxID=3401630 RepID=UPI003B429B7C